MRTFIIGIVAFAMITWATLSGVDKFMKSAENSFPSSPERIEYVLNNF